MALIGTVISSSIETDELEDGTILTLKLRMSDVDDAQSVELMRHAGVDYNPPVGSSVCVVGFSDDYQVAVACDDGIESTTAEGEYEIYGSDGEEKVSYVSCRNDGQVEVNGTGDYAVRYNELKAEFDAFVAKYNAHTHVVVLSPSPIAQALVPVTDPNLASDLTAAVKVDTVELPDD